MLDKDAPQRSSGRKATDITRRNIMQPTGMMVLNHIETDATVPYDQYGAGRKEPGPR